MESPPRNGTNYVKIEGVLMRAKLGHEWQDFPGGVSESLIVLLIMSDNFCKWFSSQKWYWKPPVLMPSKLSCGGIITENRFRFFYWPSILPIVEKFGTWPLLTSHMRMGTHTHTLNYILLLHSTFHSLGMI